MVGGDTADEDGGLRIEITPRDHRARAVAAFCGAGVILVVSVLMGSLGRDPFNGVLWFLAAVIFGIYSAVQARRQVTSPVMDFDRDGWHRAEEGAIRHRWQGLAMVWMGPAVGAFGSDAWKVLLYTWAGVDFARRVGSAPKPVDAFQIGAADARDLQARLPRWTTAEIVDGTRTSRRAAVAALAERAGR